MKKIKTLMFFLLVVLGMVFAQKKDDKSTAQFAFMLGNWEMKTAKGKITEKWVKTKDGLIGRSYYHKSANDSVLTEKINLKLVDHVFNFIVTGFEKDNTGTTIFKLISAQNNTFVFENKQHDFPQRIVYQNKGSANLLAWIEGDIKGKKQQMTFPYERR